MIGSRTLKLALVFGYGLSVTACASLLPSIVPEAKPANTVYRMSAASQNVAVQARAGALVLRVDRPTVPRPLSGNKVMLSTGGNRMLAASGAEWAEKVPDLIQGSILDVFSARPAIVGVLPVSGARTDLRIHINVRNFEAVFDQGEDSPPLATVRYTVTLANASSRDLIATYDVAKTQRASATRVSEIVRAQDAANAAAVNAVADWILEVAPKRPS